MWFVRTVQRFCAGKRSYPKLSGAGEESGTEHYVHIREEKMCEETWALLPPLTCRGCPLRFHQHLLVTCPDFVRLFSKCLGWAYKILGAQHLLPMPHSPVKHWPSLINPIFCSLWGWSNLWSYFRCVGPLLPLCLCCVCLKGQRERDGDTLSPPILCSYQAATFTWIILPPAKTAGFQAWISVPPGRRCRAESRQEQRLSSCGSGTWFPYWTPSLETATANRWRH